MDSVDVQQELNRINEIVTKVTPRSDSQLLIDQSSDIGDILSLLNEEVHEVVAEQMLERFWLLVLEQYFFPYRNAHEPLHMNNEDLYHRADMLVAVLKLYGDMYGEGLEAEARSICLALKKGCRQFLKIAGKMPPQLHQHAASPGGQKPTLRLVVNK